MVELSKAQIDAAERRGKEAMAAEPRATMARYDRQQRRMVVELTNGCTFAFPPSVVQDLENASDVSLGDVSVLGSGYALHWESLDVDFTVPGLLAGIFGTRSYLARRAGKASSPAKAAAARKNGAKGGRPRKSGTG